MNPGIFLYWLAVVICLLEIDVVFRHVYKTTGKDGFYSRPLDEPQKVRFPVIVWILAVVCTFLPIVNIVEVLVIPMFTWFYISDSNEGIVIKHWLFKMV